MPDLPIDSGATPVASAWNLEGTPEEEAELKDLLASINEKLDESEKRIDRVLIRMGLEL